MTMWYDQREFAPGFWRNYYSFLFFMSSWKSQWKQTQWCYGKTTPNPNPKQNAQILGAILQNSEITNTLTIYIDYDANYLSRRYLGKVTQVWLRAEVLRARFTNTFLNIFQFVNLLAKMLCYWTQSWRAESIRHSPPLGLRRLSQLLSQAIFHHQHIPTFNTYLKFCQNLLIRQSSLYPSRSAR